MIRLVNVVVFVGLVLFSNNSFSYNSDPKNFISELVNDAVTTLSNKNITIADKNKKIETIALKNVDIEALGMYTLGQARKNLDQATLKKI